MIVNSKENPALCDAVKILKYLPPRIAEAAAFAVPGGVAGINEIRLRINSPVSLTTENGNFILDKIEYPSPGEIEACVKNLCEGSYLSQGGNIKNGYIMTSDGCRAGICGVLDGNSDGILAAGAVTSINLRVGRFVHIDAPNVMRLVKSALAKKSGIVVFSPPGGGKTTLLKYLACAVSKGIGNLKTPRRLALIDTGGELYDQTAMRGGLIDLFSGYKKSRAIETAVRTMNPEVLICDEIFGAEDSKAVLVAKNSGVAVIASAHAGNFASLKKHGDIGTLIEAGVFETAISISKENGAYKYEMSALF